MFGYLLLAGTMLVCSNAAPEGAYGPNGGKFFEGNLDGVQGALQDIENAGSVLAKLEGQLKELDTKSGLILAAEEAIEKGIATADINNSWNGDGGNTGDKVQCLEDNQDYFGNDLNACRDKTDTASKCQELCQKTTGCVQFTWIKQTFAEDSRVKECCMKNKYVSKSSTLNGVISGPKFCA